MSLLHHYLNPKYFSSIIYPIQMKASLQSFHESDNTHRSEDLELPKQWDYLSKRLAEVQKGLTVLSKKHHALDKKYNLHAHEVTKLQVELSQDISMVKFCQLNPDFVREIASDSITQLKKEILEKNTVHFQRFQSELSLSIYEIRDSIDSKTKTAFQQTKMYFDKAVFELKQLLKKYVKEQSQTQFKFERICSVENSPTSMPKNSGTQNRHSKSSHKFFNNHTVSNISHQKSVSEQQTNKQWPSANSSTSRVNYLREKLKQFEKINKKYESGLMPQQKPDKVIEKMKGYKEYLEQSESELEPSSIFNHQSQQLYRKSAKRNNTNF